MSKKTTKKIQGKKPGASTVTRDRIDERSAGIEGEKGGMKEKEIAPEPKPDEAPPEPTYEAVPGEQVEVEPNPFEYKDMGTGVVLPPNVKRLERYLYVHNNSAQSAVLVIEPVTNQPRPPKLTVAIPPQSGAPTKIGPITPGEVKLSSANQRLTFYER